MSKNSICGEQYTVVFSWIVTEPDSVGGGGGGIAAPTHIHKPVP